MMEMGRKNMATEIRVPEVSEGVTEGTVISLAVAAGDTVEADQTLLEMETEKAVVAIPAPFAGKITVIKVSEGDTVAIGSVIMEGESSEAAAAPAEAEAAPAEAAPAEAESVAVEEAPAATEVPAPEAKAPAAVSPVDTSPAPVAEATTPKVDLTPVRTGDKVAPAAPSVRRLARELGVDIYQVQGRGPGGRISEEDVRAFVRASMQSMGTGQAASSPQAQRSLPDFSKWGAVTHEPLTKIRQITADAMGYAWSTIPMVTQHDKTDITEMEAFRRKFNQTVEKTDKLTMTAILVKVCAQALQAFPQFNSSLDLSRNELIIKHHFHIGVAVDTPNGLLVPVLKDADQKGIESLATELNEVAVKTRERRISPADMEGGTFTISNLGGIGGHAFDPIVYSPQVAILGVSRAEMEPVWIDDEFEARLRMPLSLSYDHRVIDGAAAARFLRWICNAIENPIQLVMKG
ncbi:MAG: pyruvate dehydrogenase E2 component (dihydrolipoamide acetyltransferase) [Candidatus Krumholzibacteriia bacterium]|jgi:pyruvate dehydrogenase E2 component (dihydrolipoamide acetyltransferase)